MIRRDAEDCVKSPMETIHHVCSSAPGDNYRIGHWSLTDDRVECHEVEGIRHGCTEAWHGVFV